MKKVLLTSGGTKISIDKVRSITNMSSGTFGSAICSAFLHRGYEVDFLMAEGSKTPFELRLNGAELNNLECCADWIDFVKQYKPHYNQYTYKTFQDYASCIEELIANNKYDVIVLAAAVSDYGVANYVDGKIRSSDSLEIKLTPLPKIISIVRAKQPEAYFVGFKLLVNGTDDELIAAAKESLKNNGCDMVVANDLRDIQRDDHRLLIVTPEKVVTETKAGLKLQNHALAGALVNTISENINMDGCPVCGAKEKFSTLSLHCWMAEYECGCSVYGAIDTSHGDEIQFKQKCSTEKKKHNGV